MPIVWTLPNGSLRITRLSPRWLTAHQRSDESILDVVRRLALVEQGKQTDLAGAPFIVAPESMLPTDRSQRHKWRVQGGQVRVDVTLPDLPHPKQATMDRLLAAPTLAAVKQELVDAIRSGQL